MTDCHICRPSAVTDALCDEHAALLARALLATGARASAHGYRPQKRAPLNEAQAGTFRKGPRGTRDATPTQEG